MNSHKTLSKDKQKNRYYFSNNGVNNDNMKKSAKKLRNKEVLAETFFDTWQSILGMIIKYPHYSALMNKNSRKILSFRLGPYK